MKIVSAFMLMVISWVLVNVFGFFTIILNTLRKIYRREDLGEYYFTISIGNDQVGASAIYGTEDWTISSYTYHLHVKGNVFATFFMKFINFLAVVVTYIAHGIFFIWFPFTKSIKEWNKKVKNSLEASLNREREHCKNSYINEKQEFEHIAKEY